MRPDVAELLQATPSTQTALLIVFDPMELDHIIVMGDMASEMIVDMYG